MKKFVNIAGNHLHQNPGNTGTKGFVPNPACILGESPTVKRTEFVNVGLLLKPTKCPPKNIVQTSAPKNIKIKVNLFLIG